MSEDELRAIRARADAAFRGPWRAARFSVECDRHCDEPHEVERIEAPHEYPESSEEPQVVADVLCEVPGLEMFAKANGEFIATARADVPALLDEVRRLRLALEEIQARSAIGWSRDRAREALGK